MGVSRIFFGALFLFSTITVVNAYTIVMRDGRRVEIPSDFSVTNATLTYNVGNDMQVTIQLNSVDIAATERANGQARGALLSKANVVVEQTSQTPRRTASRSITNADLEKFRRARVESEGQREELGLPSIDERRAEVAAIEDRTLEQVRSLRAQERSEERRVGKECRSR